MKKQISKIRKNVFGLVITIATEKVYLSDLHTELYFIRCLNYTFLFFVRQSG